MYGAHDILVRDGVCAHSPMADLDALLLARIQFGFTISFHIVFPAITIGLASYLAVLEACWLRTQRTVFRDLYQFWLKVFAVNFGMGVVSGLVMAYQFGTNWSHFSDFAGSVTGPLLAYEVLTAFFLEAGFLGVMLFGWKRVGPGLHFFATVMVAVGTLISSTWILASNSWMHTPAGYAIIDGRVVPTDWLAVIFNPSFPYRLTHMVVAAYLATALPGRRLGRVAPAAQARRPRDPDDDVDGDVDAAARGTAAGDDRRRARPQHARVPAGEDRGDRRTLGERAGPRACRSRCSAGPTCSRRRRCTRSRSRVSASLILTHSWDGQFPGLKEFPAAGPPDSTIVFWTFRVMVGLGLLMILLGLSAAWSRWRGTLYTSRPLHRFALVHGPRLASSPSSPAGSRRRSAGSHGSSTT